MKAWRNPHIVSFSEVVADFRSGRQTPRDFLERCIAQVEKRESQLQAFVTMDFDAARKAADASTRRYQAGQALSSVDGCPVGIKDIMSTHDMPTQMGSPAFKGWQSQQDAASSASYCDNRQLRSARVDNGGAQDLCQYRKVQVLRLL